MKWNVIAPVLCLLSSTLFAEIPNPTTGMPGMSPPPSAAAPAPMTASVCMEVHRQAQTKKTRFDELARKMDWWTWFYRVMGFDVNRAMYRGGALEELRQMERLYHDVQDLDYAHPECAVGIPNIDPYLNLLLDLEDIEAEDDTVLERR